MKRHQLIQLGAFFSILLVSTSFQNCANKYFVEVGEGVKQDKLASESVFPPGEGSIPGADPGYGTIPAGGGDGSGSLPAGGDGNGTLGAGGDGSGNIGGNTGSAGGNIGGTGGTGTGTGDGTGATGGTGTGGTGSTGGSGSIPGSGNTGGSIFGNTPGSTTPGSGFGSNQSSLPGMSGDPNGNPNNTTGGNTSSSVNTPMVAPSGLMGGGVNGDLPINVMPTPFIGKAVPLAFECSDFRSDANGSLATAKALVVEVLDNNNSVACSFTSSTLAQQMLQTKAFDLGLLDVNCGQLAPGKYALRLRDPSKSVPTSGTLRSYLTDKTTTNIVYNHSNKRGMVMQKTATNWARSDVKMNVIADRNPKRSAGDNQTNMVALDPAQCDATNSPLVIHLNSDINRPEHLVLSAPKDGVWFNILGQNSFPVANSPKRISWHRSLQYLYLVLPDANGQVKGIDQMFGNNTMGPDGQFALNGYEALGKYDGTTADGKTKIGPQDGLISKADAIYARLRLWRDENSDGVAQPHELYTLEQAGVTVIDLHFDPSYYERDRYGNETKYKSVVQTHDGRIHLMFDLWFKYTE